MAVEANMKRQRMMTYFIEATEQLILEEGVDGLSIRKIATAAGYNSATLYNYFDDLEHLALFASVRFLRDYVLGLQRAVKPGMNALEIYRNIYIEFSKASFQAPEIFYSMFFGRYSHRLDDVIRQYYELFPAELGGLTGPVRSMLTLGDIFQRDLAYMDALMAEGFVSPKKKDCTVQLIVRTHQSYIYEAWMKGERLDLDEHLKAFLALFDAIMATAK